MTRFYDEDGNDVTDQVSGPADLRKQLSKRDAELKELQEQYSTLMEERRAAERETVLKDFDPKVKEFVSEFNLDAKTVAEKYADLFRAPAAPAEPAPSAEGTAPQTPVDPAQQALAEQFAQLAQTQNGSEPSPQETTQQMADLMKAAETGDPNAITELMRTYASS